MKSLMVLLMPVLLALSCKHDYRGEPGLDGSWKMVTVVENNPTRVHVQPSDSKDVVIRFEQTTATGGALTGFTPTNQIFTSSYSSAPDRSLSIPALNMTKVGETPWGRLFVDHITAAAQYHIECGHLWITTANSKLVFRRP